MDKQHRVIFLTFATKDLPCNSNTIHIFQCKADAAFLIVGLKIYMERHCLRPFLYLVHSGIVTIEDNVTTIHWISRYTRNREYFWTRWKRGKVLCVYSKHNNGKDKSREDHGASPSLWKEYYLKTRQTIQVGSGKLNTTRAKNISKWLLRLLLEIHSVNKLVKRLNIQLEKRGLWFFLQILSNYFGVGGEEENNILIHAL